MSVQSSAGTMDGPPSLDFIIPEPGNRMVTSQGERVLSSHRGCLGPALLSVLVLTPLLASISSQSLKRSQGPPGSHRGTAGASVSDCACMGIKGLPVACGPSVPGHNLHAWETFIPEVREKEATMLVPPSFSEHFFCPHHPSSRAGPRPSSDGGGSPHLPRHISRCVAFPLSTHTPQPHRPSGTLHSLNHHHLQNPNLFPRQIQLLYRTKKAGGFLSCAQGSTAKSGFTAEVL